jgi:hypothetical protein
VGRRLGDVERRRLRDEAEAVAGLDHPAIVTLHDAGTCDVGPYLVFELLRGEPLDVRLRRGPLKPLEALRVATEVAKALAHAHARGVLHRDLKPGNVFLTEDGRVKLLDFGLAHLLGDEDRNRGGTPAYMAPEQARGGTVDARADVFAFGVMAFEALEGTLPFDIREGRSAVLDGDGPAALTAKMPDAMRWLLRRCLSADAALRPASGETLLEELVAFERAMERARDDPSPAEAELPAPSTAKIARPRLPAVFARSRLFQRLDVARARPVVWVQGPPGAGKTTLVASYLEARQLPALWYQVDEGDAEIGTFFHYLGVAARDSVPGRKPLPPFRGELAGNVDAFARRWFRELYAGLGAPFVFVLDNFQTVPHDSMFHSVIKDALEELPDTANAVVVSRAEPPAALARLRASDVLDIVSGDDLRLTLPESHGIARVRQTKEYTALELERLHERVQGWAAGLVLLLESDEILGPADAEQPETIFDYFAGEIFERADAETKKVLLETSLLSRFTAGVAEQLTGVAQAGRILASQARRAYFTSRSGERNSHYQFHPLFREFLQARVRMNVTAEELAALRVKAARVLRNAGDFEEAVALYRDAQSWDDVADLVVERARSLQHTGRSETLCRWITSIPDDVRDRKPWLHYWLAIARLSWDPERRFSADPGPSNALFEKAFDSFSSTGEIAGAYSSCSAAMIHWMPGMWRRAAEAGRLDAWIRRFEGLRMRSPLAPTAGLEARAAIGFLTALLFRDPQHPDYPYWHERVLGIALDGTKPDLRLAAGAALSQAVILKGELARAMELVAALGPVARAGVAAPAEAIGWLSWEAAHHWCAGARTAAIETISDGHAISERFGVRGLDHHLDCNEAFAWLLDGSPDKANAALVRAAAVTGSTAAEAYVPLLNGIVAIQMGDFGGAVGHARALVGVGERTCIAAWVAMGHLLAARASAEDRAASPSKESLRSARDVAGAAGLPFMDHQAALIEAHLALKGGDRAGAAASIRTALPMAGHHVFALHHLWFSRAEAAALAMVALEHHLDPDRVRRLFAREPSGAAASVDPTAPPS